MFLVVVTHPIPLGIECVAIADDIAHELSAATRRQTAI
jgi:hypothetical protein